MKKIVIIGGGLSGLLIANFLSLRNVKVYLLEKHDQYGMAKSILKLLNNSDLIDKFGYNAYNESKKKFTLTEMLIKHRNVFNYFDNYINK